MVSVNISRTNRTQKPFIRATPEILQPDVITNTEGKSVVARWDFLFCLPLLKNHSNLFSPGGYTLCIPMQEASYTMQQLQNGVDLRSKVRWRGELIWAKPGFLRSGKILSYWFVRELGRSRRNVVEYTYCIPDAYTYNSVFNPDNVCGPYSREKIEACEKKWKQNPESSCVFIGRNLSPSVVTDFIPVDRITGVLCKYRSFSFWWCMYFWS